MVTLKIALRNMFAHKMKTLIIGFIIIFGTTLAIVGNSFVDAISRGMQRSLTDSVTGEIQIYAKDAKEKLSILGNMDGSMPDIGHVNGFVHVRDTLLKEIPEIKSVIPMGTNFAMLSPGNILDIKLEELRGLYNAKPRDMDRIRSVRDHVREIVKDIERRLADTRTSVDAMLEEDELFEKAPANLKVALAPEFWETFDAKAEERIEFLANTMAPLIFDDAFLWMPYLGTVPESFEGAFSQFEIVKGEKIPPGKRGFLFSQYFYEMYVKHRVARRFDHIRKRVDQLKVKIASDKQTQDIVNAMKAQAAEIYTQVAPSAARMLTPKLQKLTGSGSSDFRELVKEFLNVTDANFRERHDFFYDEIGPHIILYKFRIGDVFPITAFSKSGYSTSVNMKVYGIYRFKSFENSPLAGNFSLMDMMSFRELYGFMTAEKRDETKALEKEMAVEEFGADNIEDMFRKSEPAVRTAEGADLGGLLRKDEGASAKFAQRRRIFEMEYTRQEMEDGVFLNAAVVLKDPDETEAMISRINEVSDTHKLGIQAIHWRDSAGFVGQMTIMVRGVLYLLVIIIFGIATFVIMNSMLMAAMERTREIGTMRAIGAQRKFIRRMFLQETMVISFIFGIIGTLIGSAIILTVGAAGIPGGGGDPNAGDVTSFFFSGDRLYLSLNFTHILVVFVCMTLVAVVSTQYPAMRAMRISPLEAMQKAD